MKTRTLGLVIAAGAACFGLGVAASRLLPAPGAPVARVAPEGGAGYVVVSPGDAGAGPRIVFDPASIQLMPDASLRLELPPGFDAGGP